MGQGERLGGEQKQRAEVCTDTHSGLGGGGGGMGFANCLTYVGSEAHKCTY